MSFEEMRIYRCWLEFYDVDENTNRRAVERVRECEDEPTGVPPSGANPSPSGEGGNNSGLGGGPTKGKGKGKTKNKGKDKNGKDTLPKKEKTEDQLARAAPRLNRDFRTIEIIHVLFEYVPSVTMKFI